MFRVTATNYYQLHKRQVCVLSLFYYYCDRYFDGSLTSSLD